MTLSPEAQHGYFCKMKSILCCGIFLISLNIQFIDGIVRIKENNVNTSLQTSIMSFKCPKKKNLTSKIELTNKFSTNINRIETQLTHFSKNKLVNFLGVYGNKTQKGM